MSLQAQTATANTMLGVYITNAGTTAVIEVFTGAPAGKTTGVFNADPGTKLVSLPCSNPIAGTPTSGLLTFSAITSAAAVASGTPASWRLKTVAAGGVGTVILEGDAAVGSGSLNFASVISSGGTVSVSSGTITSGVV